MLDNQVPDAQIVAMIQQYGISFQADEEHLKELKADGAPDGVLDAMRQATVHPEAANKPKSQLPEDRRPNAG